MNTVHDLLQNKGAEIFAVGPDDSVYDALSVMADRAIGAVLVRDDAGTGALVGILSERDYARQVILKGKASRDTRVRDIMTTSVIYVRPEQTVDDCMAIMTDRRCRHLPVVDEGDLVGVLSIGDIVKAMISEREFQIEQLESYIQQG